MSHCSSSLRKIATLLAFALALPAALRADESVSVHGPVVITGHPQASKIGIQVLKEGGNAVDAFVAASMAVGVAEPGMSGLGGKFVFMYYEAATGKVSVCISLEQAAQKLDLPAVIAAPSKSHDIGWTATCVPGYAAGLGAVHARFASKPWKDLVQPAADLARNGFTLSERDEALWGDFKPEADPNAVAIFGPDGKSLHKGDHFANPLLARTLGIVAEGGWQAFYHGEIADKLIATANKHDWPFSQADFDSIRPRWYEPLSFTYKDTKIYSSPGPIMGGATIMGVMKVLEHQTFPASVKSSRDPEFMDAYGRALLQSYPAAAKSAGDVPDTNERIRAAYTPENIQKMIAEAKSANIKALGEGKSTPKDTTPEASLPSFTPSLPPPLQSALASAYDEFSGDDNLEGCTTHLIIVDAAGNIVCATQSLGLHYGAQVVGEGLGFLMNTGMSNFAYNSPKSINQIAPGKWPRSTITPVIVVRNNKPIIAIGAPGGGRIPVAVSQVLLDILDFHRDPLSAVRQPRFHIARATSSTQAPNILDLEAGTPASVLEVMALKGWQTNPRTDKGFYFASVQVVTFGPNGQTTAASDRRRASDAQGLNIPD